MLLAALLGCQPAPPPCRAETRAWEDLDGDGWGGRDLGLVCELAAGQVGQPLDCDDEDADRRPGAEEACNGVDDDCDGAIDQDLDVVQFWRDGDGDGFGGRFASQLGCERPGSDWVRDSLDCDDADPAVNPGGLEVCGGADEDCDGVQDDADPSTDPASTTTFYRDEDGDGYGDHEVALTRCHLRVGFVPNAQDCDDADPQFHFLDLFTDADGDGFGDPATPAYACRPQAGKVTNDDDCDDTTAGITDEHDWYADPDGDGWGSGVSQGFACVPPAADLVGEDGDCDESDVFENPGVPEDCHDRVDQNCDALVDCADPDCVGVCTPPCADDLASGPLPLTLNGTTVNAGDDFNPTCGSGSAPDYAFWFVPTADGQYTFNTFGTAWDTILHAHGDCGGPRLGCNDDSGAVLQSQLRLNLTAGDGVLIVVDGYTGARGPFTLNIHR